MSVDFNNFGRIAQYVEAEAGDISQKAAEFIRDAAKGFAPVRTGWLKLRITTESAGAGAYQVVADTEAPGHRSYAAYNEYGTRYMHAQPFMAPAFAAGSVYVDQVLLPEIARKIEAGG